MQVSLGGYAGLSVGWVEGIEVNFLGLIAGIDLRRPALKLPGWGRIGFEPVVWWLAEKSGVFGVVAGAAP